MINRTQIYALGQLINAMEEAVAKLEIAFKNKNAEEFDKSKKAVLELQQKMAEELVQEKK